MNVKEIIIKKQDRKKTYSSHEVYSYWSSQACEAQTITLSSFEQDV